MEVETALLQTLPISRDVSLKTPSDVDRTDETP